MKRQSKPLCSYQNVEFRGKSLCSAAHVVLLLSLAGGLSACHKADGDAPYPRHLLWGDTHVHSKLSLDAHIYGNTHLGPDAAEDSFSGKFTVPGRGPDRWSFTVGPETLLPRVYYELAAAGYAGVWAQENTRAAIFMR